MADAMAEPWADDLDMPPGKRPRTLSDTPPTFSPLCAPSDCRHPVDMAVKQVPADVLQEWGLPRGVKLTFDPSDEELLCHLLAKSGNGQVESHPLISEFILSVDEEDQFGYTHPQRLEGVKQDGSVSYFFHRRFKVFSPGNLELQKMQNADFGVVWWHKIGKTQPVIVDGSHQGGKKIMVLYVTMKEGDKPEKTNWMMHQYHLGSGEDGEGEFVASKIFYQQKCRQSDKNVQASGNHMGEETHGNVENGELNSHFKEDPPGWDTELLDSQQHVGGIMLIKDLSQTQSSYAAEAERSISCISDNGLIGARTLVYDSNECQTVEGYDQYGNGGSVDYTAEFTTDQIFKSKDDIIKWTRDTGRMHGFVIVIKKSEMGGSGRKPRLTFWCERGGKYRDHRRINRETGTPIEEKDSSSKLLGSKKCECPFSLIGRKLATEDDWMLVVTCGVHNHPPDEQLMGSPHAGRLSAEETALLVEMFNKSARPKDILAVLKKRDPHTVVTVKTIYNARQKYRKAGKIIDTRATHGTKFIGQEEIEI